MIKKCKHCGANIKGDDMFCPKCGAHVYTPSKSFSTTEVNGFGNNSVHSDSDLNSDENKSKKSNPKYLRILLLIAFISYIAGFIYTNYLSYNRAPDAYSSLDAYVHSPKRPDPPAAENAKDNDGLLVGQSAEFTNGVIITLDSINTDFKVPKLDRTYIQGKFTIHNTGKFKFDFHPYYIGSETNTLIYEYNESMPEEFGPESMSFTTLEPGEKIEGYLYFMDNSSYIVYEDKLSPKATASWDITNE